MAAGRKDTREKQPRSFETRQRLLDGALECLIQRGYSGTTTTALCEVSGVSRGGQQHHFPTREELVVTAVQHLAARVIETIREGASKISPNRDAVREVLDLLWKATSGRWYAAGYELWIAARTDESLRAVFVPVNDSAGLELLKLCLDVLPPEVTSQKDFALNLRSTLNLLHGLALTQFLEKDPELERFTLDLCRNILLGKRPVDVPRPGKAAVDTQHLQHLEEENSALKKLLAEAMLKNSRLKASSRRT